MVFDFLKRKKQQQQYEADEEIGMTGAQRLPSKEDGEPDDMETNYQPLNLKKIFLSPKYIPWWILLILIGVATAFITIKHDLVVEKLRPWAEQVRDLPAGWLIPIAILFIISFPPLFGHEIVALLCGVIYGLWIGFGIVAAGTFLGEIATWFLFKYTLRRRAAKLERTNLNFAALARLSRDGGFWIVLIIRFSAIPSHFSTAVFATCGVNFWLYTIATAISLPKQLFLVYLGVLLLQPKSNNSSPKNIMFGISFAITIGMGFYIYWRMRSYKKILLEEQDQRKSMRLQKMNEENAASGGVPSSYPYDGASTAQYQGIETDQDNNDTPWYQNQPPPQQPESSYQSQQHQQPPPYNPQSGGYSWEQDLGERYESPRHQQFVSRPWDGQQQPYEPSPYAQPQQPISSYQAGDQYQQQYQQGYDYNGNNDYHAQHGQQPKPFV